MGAKILAVIRELWLMLLAVLLGVSLVIGWGIFCLIELMVPTKER